MLSSPELPDSQTLWPIGITLQIESRIRKEMFVGPFWNRRKNDLPHVMIAVMEEELKEIDKKVSRTPSGEIDPFFHGYVELIADMKFVLRLQDSKQRLGYVRTTLKLSSILEEHFGDSSLGGLRDESFTRHQQDLDLLTKDPSGLLLAQRKVEEIGKGNYPRSRGEKQGALAALQRYQDILQATQRLSSR